jgi:hypothetical protein
VVSDEELAWEELLVWRGHRALANTGAARFVHRVAEVAL